MKKVELNGLSMNVMEEIKDEKYGRIWVAYIEGTKKYVIEGKIEEKQDVIDELDNKYGRPVRERDIVIGE
ncbi:MAG: hypothetical protein IJS47_03370 [Clostridia bacterium]|nr:hypothetical protein [Clostridia bacterium]